MTSRFDDSHRNESRHRDHRHQERRDGQRRGIFPGGTDHHRGDSNQGRFVRADTDTKSESFSRNTYGQAHTKPEDGYKSYVKEEPAPDAGIPIKEGPNFEVSGILAEFQNQKNGVPLTFAVSPDAALPNLDLNDWRLYEFKGDNNTRTEKLSGYSCFLFGKDRRLVDERPTENDVKFIPVDHPTASRQHAVIQFRSKGGRVIPYLMDLNSTNKSFLNKKPVEPSRYIELRHQDVIKFGQSSREFVLLDAKA